MYVVSKVVLEVIPPFALLTTRLVLGFLSLWVVGLPRGADPRSRGVSGWLRWGSGWWGMASRWGFSSSRTKLSRSGQRCAGHFGHAGAGAAVCVPAAW